MIKTNNDITIFYQGGSGGFFLYYLLLLSGEYVSGDELLLTTNNIIDSVKSRIEQQFPISLKDNIRQWKATEFWPDNVSLKNTKTNKKKLFLICNPLFDKNDIQTNMEISNNTKKILLYTSLDLQLRLAYEKQAHWFNVKYKPAIRDFEYLKYIKKNYATLKGIKVEPQIIHNINFFNMEPISLQEILNNKYNNEQEQFIERWISLQPKKAQRFLNRNIN
jgi:hypothetical protein